MSFSWLEAGMLICFGISWPFSIVRSYRAKSSRGKSIGYLILIDLAYLCGILHKTIVRFDLVLILYAANFIMVSADIALYIRNARLDKRREQNTNKEEEALSVS